MEPSSKIISQEVILPYDELEKVLQISNEEAILKRKRITYSKDIPIEYTINYYRGNVYTMIMTVED